MQSSSLKCLLVRYIVIGIFSCLLLFLLTATAIGQDDTSTIRGKIAYDKSHELSWDKQKLVVPFPEIAAVLRQHVIHRPPYPIEFATWKPEQRLEWERKFIESKAGKEFLEERQRLIEKANVFKIRFELDGSFVIFDVPAGTYSIQGRVVREIGKVEYGFEVYGQIQVTPGVDEIALQPLSVEVTPLFKTQQTAPPLSVESQTAETDLDWNSISAGTVFVNFWTSKSPTSVAEQKQVQEMASALRSKFKMRLVSINVDPDRNEAMDFISGHELTAGEHGFTGGFEHRTLFDYGVRSFPSFWLIKEGKILMTQFEFDQAMRDNSDLKSIVSDRILGKNLPATAQPDAPSDPVKKQDVKQ